MCIAIAKPKGVKMPSWDYLYNAFTNNPDGGGFAFAPGDRQVYIKKGLMTWEAFKGALEALMSQYNTTQMGMLIHTRITTHGGTNPGNTHPFPIVADEAALHKTAYVSPYAVIHNGIITLTSSAARLSKGMSDTAVFVEKYLTLIAQNRNWFYNKANMELIEKLADSKIAILNGDGDIIHTSGFTTENGVLYSNTSYKDGYFRKIGAYSSYGYTGYSSGSYSSAQNSHADSYATYSKCSAYTSFKLTMCNVGDTVECDCGSFEITSKERDMYFFSEPNEFGLSAIYQRYEDENNVDPDYAGFFSDYEYMGYGIIYDRAIKPREFKGDIVVYCDQFIGGYTPDIALDALEEYEEEEDSTTVIAESGKEGESVKLTV